MSWSRPSERNWRALLGAFALLFLYGRMHAVFDFGARFGGASGSGASSARGPLGPFLYIAPEEYLFWLCHAALVVPAALLLSCGFRPELAALLAAAERWLESRTPRQWTATAAAYGLAVALVASWGHEVVLGGLPITDDENAVDFGARVLSHGDVCVHGFGPEGAFNTLFLYTRNGCTTSMDYLGVVAFRALSLLTGTRAALYAAFAGLTAVAVVHAALRLSGSRGALVAALIWWTSPLQFALSTTTHGHLVSRGFIALATASLARLATLREGESAPKNALTAGLCAGLALSSRPFETLALLGPAIGWVSWQAVHRRAYGLAAPLALGAALPLIALGWYDQALTGSAFIPPRLAMKSFGADLALSVTARAAQNLGFNLVLLTVYFFGPAGVFLVGRAMGAAKAPALALGSGLVLHLLLALGHDNTGIHAVGPIHYTDAAVSLTLLATRGFLKTTEDLRVSKGATAALATSLGCYALLGYGAFNYTQMRSLYAQSWNQRAPFSAVAEAKVHHAIVLAPGPTAVADLRGDRAGSWVSEPPPPEPYFGNDILYARPFAGLPELRQRFPDRRIYRLLARSKGDLCLVPAEEDGARPRLRCP